MKRSTLGLSLIAAACIAASSGFAFGGGKGRQGLTPNTKALERGCRTGGFQGVNATNPSWVSVEPADTPKVAEGVVRKSQVTSEDYPANHESHDWNFFVKLDPKYEYLNGDANHTMDSEGKDSPTGDRCIEMEWETKHFDMRFWPVVGDRVMALGRWIFDCGHPPYRTEIHPPKLVAFTRLSPTTFAGDTVPSYTNKSFVYINGQGGYYYDKIGGMRYTFDVPVPPRPEPATQTPPTAPPAPTAAAAGPAELRAQVISTPFGGPVPTLTPMPDQNKVRVTYNLAGVTDPQRWNLYQNPLSARPVSSPKFGAVIAAGWREPVLTKGYRVLRVIFDNIKINEDHDGIPAGSGEWKLWVHVNGTWFPIPGLDDVDDGDTVRIGRAITVTVPDNGELALQTTGWESDEIDEHFRMDSAGSLPMTPTSRGLFSKIKKAAKKVGGAVKKAAVATGGAVKKAAVATGGAVKDAGQAVGGAVKDTAVAVKDKAADAVSAVKDKIMDAVNNESIGVVKARFTSADNFGIGSLRDHKSTAGDFQLRYRIEEVQRIPAGTANGVRALGETGPKRVTRQ